MDSPMPLPGRSDGNDFVDYVGNASANGPLHKDASSSSSSIADASDDNAAAVAAAASSSYQDETDDLLNLFSTTLRSLAADACAIRQMTDMADVLKKDGAPQQQPQPQEQIADSLRSIDHAVSNIEHKVLVLRQILNEEKAAVHKFETSLRQEADEQTDLLEGLLAALALRERDQQQEQQNEEEEELQLLRQQQQLEEEDIQVQVEDDEANESMVSRGSNSSSLNLSYDNHRLQGGNARTSDIDIRSSYGNDSNIDIDNTLTNSSWDEVEHGSSLHNSYLRSASASASAADNRASYEYDNSLNSSFGSASASAGSIRSHDNGSFTRRSGLLRSRYSQNANHNNHNNSSFSSPRRHQASTPHKRVVGFQEDVLNRSNHSRSSHNNTYHPEGTDPEVEKKAAHAHPPNRPCFVLVTDAELDKHPRYGPHMSRYDINEALEEIQTVVWNHMDLKDSKQKHRKSAGRRTQSTGSTTYVSPLDRLSNHHHQSHNQSWNEINEELDSHHQRPLLRCIVSEQELRENCAFFKHGESTARSTLQLLCSLKRLKQVPSKQSQVTYVCLFGV